MNPNPKAIPLGKTVFWACIAIIILSAGLAAIGLMGFPGSGKAGETQASLVYAGTQTCRQCHGGEYKAWTGTMHQKAMQHAGDGTVAGDFNSVKFTYGGVTSTFFRRDGKFFVNTDGADGKLRDFQIKYTFGVRPLQQYLVTFPDGRMQVLPFAWDSRSRKAGGQRWFHMYPGQKIGPDDPLHWTGIHQNWNHMCASCHTTNLRRNYDAVANGYNTSWSEINVGCEACHGPGSRHVDQARRGWGGNRKDDGLVVHFGGKYGWRPDEKTDNPIRTSLRTDHQEIETCGLCHSRRRELKEGALPGAPLLDSHLVSFLDDPLYHPDGQMQAEVFTYGSFLQSKMYEKGVTCSDCHEAHSLKLRAPGNGLCLQCHGPEKYDRQSHHRHATASSGAQCVSCHMPEHIYMQIQPRHDHSLRVPRPDQSLALGTPNACNQCHRDKSPQWAADAVEKWFGPVRKGLQAYGPALHAARREQPEAAGLLIDVMADKTQPAIARATAFKAFEGYLGPRQIAGVAAGLKDANPLVRIGALQGLKNLAVSQRWQLFASLLKDPVLAVRVQAASLLGDVPVVDLPLAEQVSLQNGIDEYLATLRTNFDRPEARVELGLFYQEQGKAAEAEKAYLAALELSSGFEPAVINLADLYAQNNQDDKGWVLLGKALSQNPDFAAAHHALGLLMVRKHQPDEAVRQLAQAVKLAPANARYTYVYAVALDGAGKPARAMELLEENHRRHPSDRDTLAALASLNRKAGRGEDAVYYARKLKILVEGKP